MDAALVEHVPNVPGNVSFLLGIRIGEDRDVLELRENCSGLRVRPVGFAASQQQDSREVGKTDDSRIHKCQASDRRVITSQTGFSKSDLLWAFDPQNFSVYSGNAARNISHKRYRSSGCNIANASTT